MNINWLDIPIQIVIAFVFIVMVIVAITICAYMGHLIRGYVFFFLEPVGREFCTTMFALCSAFSPILALVTLAKENAE